MISKNIIFDLLLHAHIVFSRFSCMLSCQSMSYTVNNYLYDTFLRKFNPRGEESSVMNYFVAFCANRKWSNLFDITHCDNMDYIKRLLITLLPELNIIPGPFRSIPETYIYIVGLSWTIQTPEPGFSRDSPNSWTGLFPETLRTPKPGFSRDYPNSRTYNMIIKPGFSRTYLILRTKCLPRLYESHSPPHGGLRHKIETSTIADNFLVMSDYNISHITSQ